MAYKLSDLTILNKVFDKLFKSVGITEGTFPDFVTQQSGPLVIDQPTTFYVSSTGNDNNIGGINDPFLTIQAAIDYVTKFEIRSLVIIQVGSGTFDGFQIQGNRIGRKGNTGSFTGISIQGTSVPATLTQSSNSGTITSLATGTVIPRSVTITDNTKNWAVNDLKGKFVYFPSDGTYTEWYMPIYSNTANTFTVPSQNLGDFVVSYPYTIVDMATIVSMNAKRNTYPGYGFYVITPGNKYEWLTGGLSCASIKDCYGSVELMKLKMDVSTNNAPTTVNSYYFSSGSRGISIENSQNVHIVACSAIYGSVGPGALADDAAIGASNSSLILEDSYIGGKSGALGNQILFHTFTNSTAIISYSVFEQLSTNGSVCVQFNGTLNMSTSIVATQRSSATLAISADYFSWANSNSLYLDNSTIINSLQGVGPNAFPSTWNLTIYTYNIGFSNVGTCFLAQRGTKIFAQSIGGSGNTTGFFLTKGGSIQVDPTTAPGAATEITMDGTNYTLATMRAASPKLLTNTYGTIIYE